MEILTFLIIGMFIGMLAAFGIVGVVVHFMDKEYLRQTIYKDFTDESSEDGEQNSNDRCRNCNDELLGH